MPLLKLLRVMDSLSSSFCSSGKSARMSLVADEDGLLFLVNERLLAGRFPSGTVLLLPRRALRFPLSGMRVSLSCDLEGRVLLEDLEGLTPARDLDVLVLFVSFFSLEVDPSRVSNTFLRFSRSDSLWDLVLSTRLLEDDGLDDDLVVISISLGGFIFLLASCALRFY